MPGAPSETPAAREIVPHINRLAAAVRECGGTVAWVQAAFQPEGPSSWPLFFDTMVSPAVAAAILDALAKTRFNRTAAAKLLGITFRALRYRMERLGIN